MIDVDTMKTDLVKRLRPLHPEQVILFGSYAHGNPSEDSDIDLYVVTPDSFIPQSWKDKNSIYLRISKSIRDLRKRVPIDLIVHTKAMHEKFIKLNSSFSREINAGIRLI